MFKRFIRFIKYRLTLILVIINRPKVETCYYKFSKDSKMYRDLMKEIKDFESVMIKIRSLFLFKSEFVDIIVNQKTRKLIGFYLDEDHKHRKWLEHYSDNIYLINEHFVIKNRVATIIELIKRPFPGVYSFNEILFDEAPKQKCCDLIHYDNNYIIIKIGVDDSLTNNCFLSKDISGAELIDEYSAYMIKNEAKVE